MRISCLLLLLVVLNPRSFLQAQMNREFRAEVAARIAEDTALVGLVFLDLVHHDSLLLNPDHRFHAASTMKVPVLIELTRRAEAGVGRWDEPVVVRNRFRSIVDSSSYRLDPADDSDSTLYLEEGHEVALATLARRMIVRSSNLATNVVMEPLVHPAGDGHGEESWRRLDPGPPRVEDGKAFARGLNNTTTARDWA